MAAVVIPFPAPVVPQNEPNEFMFWVEALDHLSPGRRHHLVDLALANTVIDARTAETLHAMWQDQEDGA